MTSARTSPSANNPPEIQQLQDLPRIAASQAGGIVRSALALKTVDNQMMITSADDLPGRLPRFIFL